MIAEVYPIRRLSRRMNFFDYEIPDSLSLSRGSFVEIPLRSRTVIGIVKRVKDIPARGIQLKSILRALPYAPLKDEELYFFEEISQSIAQPVANLFSTSLPLSKGLRQTMTAKIYGHVPLTIPTSEIATIARLAKQMTERRRAFVQVQDLRRAAAVLAHYFNQRPAEKRIIICPHVHDVRLLTKTLSAFSPIAVTGEETDAERFEAWKIFRRSKDALLLTTRVGMLYADVQTACVCLIRSGHPDHVQHDRNPRLDTRRVMDTFCERFTTNLFFLDVCPLAEDLFRFGEEHILCAPALSFTCIDASKERPASPHAVIASSCVQAIEETLEKRERVLLIYNKKGYAVRLRCQDCDHRFVCTRCGHMIGVNKQTTFCVHCGFIEPIPLKCPTCRSTRIHVRGYGSERIAETLRNWFPVSSVEIVDKEHQNASQAPIVLVTRYYLENIFDPFQPESFGCVIHLDPDTPLFFPSFQATQRAVWSLSEWAGMASAVGADFYLQTDEEELFRAFLTNPIDHLKDELFSRRSFDQPPFARWFSVKIREEEKKKRELEEHLLREALGKINGVSINAELQLHVPYDRVNDVLDLFLKLDDRYIIDTNLFS